jgi:hypothetical protein
VSACVVATPESVTRETDGPACVVRGQHAATCADPECTGCLPSPAAPGSRVCGWHHDGTRDMLTGSTRERVVPSLADLYEALAEAPVGARGAGDGEAAQVIGDERRNARSAIKAMLVSWCLVLAEPAENGGRGLSVPDERVIANGTQQDAYYADADADVEILAFRAYRAVQGRAEDPAEKVRAHEASLRCLAASQRHRDRAIRARQKRLTGADVIAALADHVDRHLAWLLASEHASQLVHEVTFAWRWAWALAGGGRRLPTIRCSCGGLVPMALAEDAGERAVQVFTCPDCGNWGVLDWWRRAEGVEPGPMPLAAFPEWLAEHHGLAVTLAKLRRWALRRPIPGEHEEQCTGVKWNGLTCTGCLLGPGLLTPVTDDGEHVPDGPRQGRVLRYDPEAVAVVVRRMASEGRLRSA